MANSLIIFNKLVVLFTFVFIGWLSYKKNWVNDSGSAAVSKLVIYIFNPALAISLAVGHENRPSMHMMLLDTLLVLIFYSIMIGLSPVVARLLRVPADKRGLLRIMMTFGNTGFLGVPLITALYGRDATIFLLLYVLMFNLLYYSMAEHIYKKYEKNSKPFKLKDMLNIGTISCVIALALFFGNVPVPQIGLDILNTMGDTCIILSMLVTGFALAKIELKYVILDWQNVAFTVIKMLVIPLTASAIIHLINPDIPAVLLGVMTIVFGVPTGSMTVIGCELHGIDGTMPSRGYALTTLVVLVTLPIVALTL